MELNLTSDEKRAIAALKRIAKIWPKTLWLLADGMSLNVMRYKEDGKPSVLKTDGYDPDYIVDTIDGIYSEGGDW